MPRFTRGVVAAIALATSLALPMSALASDQTSGAIPETLTVPATSTITGAPTSIAYGSSLGGANVVGTPTPAGQVNLVFTSNDPAGFKANIVSTDLTATNGTIANTNRLFAVQTVTGSCPGMPAAFQTGSAATAANTTSGYQSTKASGIVDTLCSPTAPGTVTWTNFYAKLAIPASQAAGAYTGTITFTLTEK